jgi:putative hydrolase of the HAD superfamily
MNAAIFDLDDTLYPERQYVLSGFRAVAEWASRNFDIPLATGLRELETLFHDGVRGNTFDRWLQAHGIGGNESVAELVRVYRSHIPVITLYPDVHPVLEQMRSQNWRLGLVSDGYADVQRRKIEALHLYDLFDAVVLSDDFGREAWKPSPRPFLAALARLAADPVHAVYVADNPSKDFIGARSIGMATIRIRRSDALYCHLEPQTSGYAADMEIAGLGVLQTALCSLRRGPQISWPVSSW